MLLIILALTFIMALSLAANLYAFARLAQTVKELVEAREELSSVKKEFNSHLVFFKLKTAKIENGLMN